MESYALVLVVVTVVSIGQLVIGAGYRTLGTIALKAAGAASIGAALGGAVALLGFNPGRSAPYAEGAGIVLAALFAIGALIGGLVAFVVVFVKLKRRHPQTIFSRSAGSRVRVAIAIAGLLPAAACTVHAYYLRLPSLHSDAVLLEQLSRGGEGRLRSEQELLQRGDAVVPSISARLKHILSNPVDEPIEAIRLLELLGKFRGARATETLRLYLGDGYPPSVRARAAIVLGVDLHDMASEAAIAKLLVYRDREWRDFQPLVFDALASLGARSQVPLIVAALELEPEIARSNIGDDIVRAASRSLALLGGPEASTKLIALSEDPLTREAVLRAIVEIDSDQSRQILAKALDDPSLDVRRRCCEALMKMPSLRPRLSYYSCPSPTDSGWNPVVADIRAVVGGRPSQVSESRS